MTKKKSNAQIKRMMKRAETRGEAYTAPPPKEESPIDNNNEEDDNDDDVPEEGGAPATADDNDDVDDEEEEADSSFDPPLDKEQQKIAKQALTLKKELETILNDESLRAKERRSHKRKAEAIAAEAAGCTVEEMQKWYEENQELLNEMEQKSASKKNSADNKKDTTGDANNKQTKGTPYILFVGQLNFTTTKETLHEHIRKELKEDDHKVTKENVKVRLLTDPKTKKSRGMAFVELETPELMYACLKLHHGLLEGRRLNIERSAGARNKEARQSKIKKFREEQEQYLSKVVDSILAEYIKTGELKDGELDEGAVALCKRYTASLVDTAIKQYIEKNGRTMDNPSAFFTFLLTKLAADKVEQQGSSRANSSSSGRDKERQPKRSTQPPPKRAKTSSVSSKSSLPGVDFSLSEKSKDAGSGNMSEIFPSLARGRGRGRGYM